MTASCVLRGTVSLMFAGALAIVPAAWGQDRFSFAPHLELDAPARTLSVGDVVIEGRTVRVEGGDAAQPAKPFVFDWGDGETSEAGFPATHTYARADRNYVVTVTARYPRGVDLVQTVVRFRPVRYEFRRDRSVPRRASIPREDVALASTMPGYEPPADATCFGQGEITVVPREAIEYVLDVGHRIQMDFCNGDTTRPAARRHVVLKQTSFPGCGAFWFTDPVAMLCHPDYLAGEVGFSSLLHELGHNLTLNSPAAHRFGGKTDGPMNAIVSETLAQVFQHATIHEILNARGHYGLSEELCRCLRDSGVCSVGVLREAHRKYLADPGQYTTYNDPATEEDDAFNTFMTVAYVFCDLAEKRGDYRKPLKRMMRLLQTFSAADHKRFQQRANESFRATFLVAAMSHGFESDLRERFRELNFPVSDKLYVELRSRRK